MTYLLNSILGLGLLLYPVAVYFGMQVLMPWQIAAALLAVLSIRFYFFPTKQQWGRNIVIAGAIYCIFAIWLNSELSLRIYPVWINFCLFLIFFLSLIYPPPIIERLARLQHPSLPEQGIIYTRKVTQVWCGFFVVNAAIAAATALWASFFWWSLYNGCIAYVLIGLLMGIEYLVRIKTQSHVQ